MLLSFLLYAAGSGGLFHAVGNGSGPLKYACSMTDLVQDLADGLRARMGAKVTKAHMTHDNSLVRITLLDGVKAKQAIMAIPPSQGASIEYDTSLVDSKQKEMMAQFQTGTAVACFATFSSPFWKERGLSGTVTTGGEWVSTAFDVTLRKQGLSFCRIAGGWAGLGSNFQQEGSQEGSPSLY